MPDLELRSESVRSVRKRVNKAPDPRFKPDVSNQLDLVHGSPALSVPRDHFAWRLKELLESLDWSSAEAKYSSQGQHGYHPKHVVGALVYGSLRQIHHSTKLGALLTTDLASRLVAGGHMISAGRLRAFRRENEELFSDLLRWTSCVSTRLRSTAYGFELMRRRRRCERSSARRRD
jgi:hypothetical protein